MIGSVITGTGSCIPEAVIGNKSFLNAQFFGKDGDKLAQSNVTIIEKFNQVTGILERRYASSEQNASDLAYLAAHDAVAAARVNPETLDYIIVAHNFGDIRFGTNRVNQVPSLASKVKARLGILNPDCVAYDLVFGCPGWLEGVIQASHFISCGNATRCLIIGAETLSRIIDQHDRDSMIFSDGAGAVVLEATKGNKGGILSHKTQTHALNYGNILEMAPSYFPYSDDKKELFLKMEGRKVYEFALTHVPNVIKTALDKAGVPLEQVSKVLVHQANEKMDRAILERLFKLYGKNDVPENIMPLTVDTLGNSSVATIPTLLDLLIKNQLDGHSVSAGEIIVMVSVGAGMNINALVYRV